MEQIKNFRIIGIEIETTNKNGKSTEDLGKLWEQFYGENVPSKIPNKISDEIYSIYSDYESDYKGKYSALEDAFEYMKSESFVSIYMSANVTHTNPVSGLCMYVQWLVTFHKT